MAITEAAGLTRIADAGFETGPATHTITINNLITRKSPSTTKDGHSRNVTTAMGMQAKG